MKRREFITGVAAVGAAMPLGAQIPTTYTSEPLTGTALFLNQQEEPKPSPEELAAQYKICQLRGHIPTDGNISFSTFAVITPEMIAAHTPHPRTPYVPESSTGWQTCWYCKKQYRYVTKIEEKESA